jgi:hypothetical protein
MRFSVFSSDFSKGSKMSAASWLKPGKVMRLYFFWTSAISDR